MVDFVNPIQQQFPDTCAIKSQQLILQDFGIDVSETECVQYCHDHGWYVPGGGTMPENVGNLLVDVGIPCTKRWDANIFDIMNEIQQGHKVIVGVDANELWKDGPINAIIEWLRDIFIGEQANHALIVAGLDYSDPDNPYVILTDPGSGEAGKPYPLDQFMDAWADSQHFICYTDIPTPKITNEFIANGLTDLHLPEIAGVNHDTFIDFCDYSHQIDFSQMPALYNAFDAFPMNPDWNFNDALSFANLPATSMPLTDISSPIIDFGTPMAPSLNPQQQIDFFQNTIMDVQQNLLTSFPSVSFIPDPMFQYPVSDIFGFTNIVDPMNVDIMSGIPSCEFPHTMTDVMNEQNQAKLDQSRILEQERDLAVNNYHKAMDSGNYEEALKWENIANSHQQDLYDLWDTPNYSGLPAVAPGIND